MQVWFNIWKSINVIYHFTHLQIEKLHNFHINKIFNWYKKAFDKINHLFIEKSLHKFGTRGNLLCLIKRHPQKKLKQLSCLIVKDFPQHWEGCPLSPFLVNIIQEVLAKDIRKENEIQGIQIGKEEISLICRWHDFIWKIPSNLP